MSSNISEPLHKKYDNPSEKVRKTSWNLDDTEKAFVTSTDRVSREENTDMVDKKKPMW